MRVKHQQKKFRQMKKQQPNIVLTDYSSKGILDTLFTPKIQQLLFNTTFEGIKKAHKSNRNEVIVCSITQVEATIALPKSHWVNALKTMLEYYVIEENYSMCTQVNKLIQDVEDEQRLKK